MTTRRRYLAGLGTLGLTGLAGCEALDRSDGDSTDRLEETDLDGWIPDTVQGPSPFPFSLPSGLAEEHEARARSLLGSVPQDPSIPNGAVENRIREERAAVEDRVAELSDLPTALDELRVWRSYRSDAANVYGSYKAATGQDDGAAIEDRRNTVREQIGGFEAAMEYSAASPLEAVLVYAPIEERLDEATHESLPHNPYPEDPIANVEQAGDAFESVEAAAAALEDARGIQETYLGTRQETASRWSTLIDAFRGLEIAVDRTQKERIPDPEDADHESMFASEVTGVDLELFQMARRGVLFRHDPLRTYRDAAQYAMAALEAGRRLARIAAFDAVITALESGDEASIQEGETTDGQSVANIKSAASTAAETITALHEVEYPHLSAAIADGAIESYRVGRRNLDEEYFDPEHAEASFRYASLYGAAAPSAASFVAERIQTAAADPGTR